MYYDSSCEIHNEVFLRNEIEGTLKLAIFEEAWALENTTQGTALIKEMLRTGRSLNCGCGIVTQSAKDYNDQDVKEQVGVRFAFRAEDEREQEDVLKFFDLPVNDENRTLLANLEEGECLFRDIYGRTAKIAVDVLFSEWVQAFNTVSKKQQLRRFQSNEKGYSFLLLSMLLLFGVVACQKQVTQKEEKAKKIQQDTPSQVAYKFLKAYMQSDYEEEQKYLYKKRKL
ncbi:hypothetical protein GCM10020331_011890 [Ectobacillus funiculus]